MMYMKEFMKIFLLSFLASATPSLATQGILPTIP